MTIFEKHRKMVEEATKVMNFVFGEENVDVISSGISSTVRIYFPKLTLSNAKGQTHEIKDLYVQIGFKSERLIGEFMGTRTTFSQIEYGSSYAHSHLTGAAVSGFDHFCEGSSNFTRLKAELMLESWLDSANEIREDKLLMFEGWLHEMIGFLEWESLDGRPYKYIENIADGVNQDDLSSGDLKLSWLRFLKNVNIENLTIVRHANIGYALVDDSNFEAECFKAATKFQYRSTNNTFFHIPKLHKIGSVGLAEFSFKGKRLDIVVVPSDLHHQMRNMEAVAHRKIKEYIKSKLIDELRKEGDRLKSLSEKEATHRRVAKVRETYNKRESVPENLLPLSTNQPY